MKKTMKKMIKLSKMDIEKTQPTKEELKIKKNHNLFARCEINKMKNFIIEQSTTLFPDDSEAILKIISMSDKEVIRHNTNDTFIDLDKISDKAVIEVYLKIKDRHDKVRAHLKNKLKQLGCDI